MKTQKTYNYDTPFRDFLFITLMGVYIIFVLSFLMIRPSEETKKINVNAEYLITLTWDSNSTDDLDIWMQDPYGNVLFFRHTPVGMMHLDRDDKGIDEDKMVLPDGRIIKYDYNQEIVTIRGIVPGEWILNIHMYKKNDRTPTNVTVKMDKVNPRLKTVIYETYKLRNFWEEITVARFNMAADGTITPTGKLFKRLIKSKSVGTID